MDDDAFSFYGVYSLRVLTMMTTLVLAKQRCRRFKHTCAQTTGYKQEHNYKHKQHQVSEPMQSCDYMHDSAQPHSALHLWISIYNGLIISNIYVQLVHMYVYMAGCMHVCMYICVYVCMYVGRHAGGNGDVCQTS